MFCYVFSLLKRRKTIHRFIKFNIYLYFLLINTNKIINIIVTKEIINNQMLSKK